jgi:hypothetical protein
LSSKVAPRYTAPCITAEPVRPGILRLVDIHDIDINGHADTNSEPFSVGPSCNLYLSRRNYPASRLRNPVEARCSRCLARREMRLSRRRAGDIQREGRHIRKGGGGRGARERERKNPVIRHNESFHLVQQGIKLFHHLFHQRAKRLV